MWRTVNEAPEWLGSMVQTVVVLLAALAAVSVAVIPSPSVNQKRPERRAE
jgi:hypothetical protein